jgi:hypothetical protein
MTEGMPDIVGPIGGLVGIGVMAGAANAIINKTQDIGGKKKKKKGNGFSSGMDERIRRMI